MKLKKKLEELNQDEIVCIGSRSAFFFIGYPKDFLEHEEEFTEHWRNSFVRNLESANNAYENCMNNPPKPETEVKRRERDENLNRMVDMLVPHEVLMKEWEDKCNQLLESKNTAQKKLDKFTPFIARDIKECYSKIDNDGTVIIVRGNEVAPFWFKKEFDLARRKGLI